MEPDLIVADIITNEFQVDPTRVVVYNQNWEPPSDSDLFIVISTRQSSTVSVNNRFDPDTSEEIKSFTGVLNIDIEVTSKTREAMDRKEEILLAMISTYSQQKQEENSIKINRAGDILDLSFIEGASALHRYRISYRIHYMKQKRTAIIPFENFRESEVNTNG